MYKLLLSARNTNTISSDSKGTRLYVINSILIGFAIGSFILLLILKIFNAAGLSYVSGNSMYSTFHDGDIVQGEHILQNTSINYGDIVTFKVNSPIGLGKISVIKRIVGMPGDTLHIKNGKLYVNGKLSTYNFSSEYISDPGILKEKITLPFNCYFAMGDNVNESMDCRVFGFISRERLELKINAEKIYKFTW